MGKKDLKEKMQNLLWKFTDASFSIINFVIYKSSVEAVSPSP